MLHESNVLGKQIKKQKVSLIKCENKEPGVNLNLSHQPVMDGKVLFQGADSVSVMFHCPLVGKLQYDTFRLHHAECSLHCLL